MEKEKLRPLTNAIAQNLRDNGKTVPSDDELLDHTRDLLSYFEILIKAERGDIA